MIQARVCCTVAVIGVLCLFMVTVTESAPMPSSHNNPYYNNEIEETPDEVLMELIARFGQTIMRARDDLENRHNRIYNAVEDTPVGPLKELIARYDQTRAHDSLENSKRTVDFGLARGFSGIQEAKHRMGLAAANFAGGPGRRRRSETEA